MTIKMTKDQKKMVETALEAYAVQMLNFADEKLRNNEPGDYDYFTTEASKYYELLRDFRVMGK